MLRNPTVGAAILALIPLAAPAAAAQTTWERNAAWLRTQIDECATGDHAPACRYFAARALDRLFKLPGVCDERTCLGVTQLGAAIPNEKGWSALGTASRQDALDRARAMAVGGMPVVAVQASTGWVALIMPGEAYPSERWRRNVPTAVGTRLDRPESSVYGKGLNFLFSDPAKVTLYVHR